MYNATEAEIAGWKAKYGKVHKLTVTSEDEVEYTAYLKPVDRKALSAASALGKSDPIKFNEVLLNNTWLGGDEEIKANDELFLAASGQLEGLLTKAQGKLARV